MGDNTLHWTHIGPKLISLRFPKRDDERPSKRKKSGKTETRNCAFYAGRFFLQISTFLQFISTVVYSSILINNYAKLDR